MQQLLRAEPGGGGDAITGDALERQADRIGARIGAALGPGAVAEGLLPAAARNVAERYLGPLPPITVRESDAGLAPRALASTRGTHIQFRAGSLSSGQAFHRALLGHELVHVAQQQRIGVRTQHQEGPAQGAPAADANAGQAAQAGPARAGQEANPNRALDVPARAARVRTLLDQWFTGRDILQVFQACSESEFLALERATDFRAVLDKLDEWSIVQLGAAGPILPEYRARVNRVRADYLQRITREWGVQRAEVFTLYVFDTATGDDIEAVLTLLAGDQELYRTVRLMPTVKQRLVDRGIDLNRFQDRGWKAVDIATGLYHGFEAIMATAPAVQQSMGIEAASQAAALPEPYREAVTSLDMAAFAQAFTPGNVLLGAADLALLGLPSMVRGVVYELPRSVITGIGELSQGHVVAGVERLTVPVITVIGAALGIRAFRQARVAALLELTVEGRALYDGLKRTIGAGGLQRVAGYVQKSSAARILVAEAGAEGIVALEAAGGDVAAARALLAEGQMLVSQAEMQAALNATRLSVETKLTAYLLNPDHPVGGSKARWFEQALGYNRTNMDGLARQIVFDPSTAVETAVTQYGTKFNQVIPITGANGRVIDVTFAWIRNNDGVVRLVTGIPTAR